MSINQELDDEGIIRESRVHKGIKGAEKALQKGDHYLRQQSYTAAAALYVLVIHELIPILGMIEDGDKQVHSLLDHACGQLAYLTSQIESHEKQGILQMLKEMSIKKTIHQWAHWHVSILQACANLVSAEEWSSFDEYLVSLISYTESSWQTSYLSREIALIRQKHHFS